MIIDIIVIAVLLISALISFIRGFVRECLTILGVVGGLAAAWFGGPALSPMVRGWLGVVEGAEPARLLGVLPYPILADILSYGMIFLTVVILLSIISHMIAEGIRSIGLGSIDRTLGIIFGLLRGLLLMAILYLPFHLSLDVATKKEWFVDSKTQPWLEGIADGLTEYLPDSALKQIKDSTDKVREEAGGKSSAVKERLEEIDLLQGDKDANEQAGPPMPSGTPVEVVPAPVENKDGYSEEFREKMDEMFQQQPAPAQQQEAPQ
jgi:membrane protein required for colicin V production